MFIYTYTEAEGTESRRVASEIDLVMKPAFGDRPGANGHQNTGPRLSARMLQEYMAAQNELVDGIITEDMVQLVDMGNYGVGMNVVSPCGLTLCHSVQGSNVGARIDIENLHYHQQWSASPMETIDRTRLVEASRLFLEHAPEWKEQLAAAFKADSKGVKMRNMALNNMDAYLERYFDGTDITYCCDRRRADGHNSRLLVRLNAYKTLALPIPHDDFINHLDLVKPHMVEFAYMARDGRFTVRSEVRDDWQLPPDGETADNACEDEKPRQHGLKGWFHRLIDGDAHPQPVVAKSPLQLTIDEVLQGKKLQYHLIEDDETKRYELHIRLNGGRAMIINLNQSGDITARVKHDIAYLPRLVELGRLFPYQLIGPRKKTQWITAPRSEE